MDNTGASIAREARRAELERLSARANQRPDLKREPQPDPEKAALAAEVARLREEQQQDFEEKAALRVEVARLQNELHQVLEKLEDHFKRAETDFLMLLRLDWAAAHNKLNELRRFGTFDGLIAIKPPGFTIEPNFTERVANLLKEVEALPQTLVDEVEQAFRFDEDPSAPSGSGGSGSAKGRSALTSSVNIVPLIDPDTIVVNLAVVLNAERAFATFDGAITPAKCRVRLIGKLRDKLVRVDHELQSVLKHGDFGLASELLAVVSQVADSLTGPTAFKNEVAYKMKCWREQYDKVKGNRKIRLTEAKVDQVKSDLSDEVRSEFFDSCVGVNQAAKELYAEAVSKLAKLSVADLYPLFDALRINALLGLYASELRSMEEHLIELFSSHTALTLKIKDELAKLLSNVEKLSELGQADRVLRSLQCAKADVLPKYKLWLPAEYQLWDLLDVTVNHLLEKIQRYSRKVTNAVVPEDSVT
eukprot:TRINITY_DN9154_c0_g1_i2.p1 TRINITY_DN9154_c0_g1~~TRINITY_DN9154_c0_g1_i2.p1  ORF type:complete len:475 (+),score=177.55 TRINITY_DN9154_c0_g1_i2:1375-2799(+)